MMNCLRYIKSGMVGAIALFFTLVALNNLLEFNSNFTAVQHVLSMDTTFQAPVLMKRAITQPSLQLAAYYLIISWELMTAILCWFGFIKLLRNARACDTTFHHAKNVAFTGLFSGFLLYMLGFMVIGGEWFCMWQSPTWNAQPVAGLFVGMIMFVMIFLSMSEQRIG